MGAHCASLEPATCQRSPCCGEPCNSISASSSTPVTALPASARASTPSKEVVDDEQQGPAFEPEPATKRLSKIAAADSQASDVNDNVTSKVCASPKGEEPKAFPKVSTPESSDDDSSSNVSGTRVSAKEKKSATLRSAIAKVKGAASGTVGELKTFRKFLKPRFSTPGAAFDEFIGFATQLDKTQFLSCLEERQYVGNSERLFQALSNGGNILERDAFKQRLVAIGRMQPPKKKEISFGNVVLHSVQSMKKADLLAGDGEDDGWDPPPPAIVPLKSEIPDRPYVPIPKSEIPEAVDANPFFSQEAAAASGQPCASGQPPRQRIELPLDDYEVPASAVFSPSPSPTNVAKAKVKAKAKAGAVRSGRPPRASTPEGSKSPTGNKSPMRRRVASKKDNGAGVRRLLNPASAPEDARLEGLDGGLGESLEYSGNFDEDGHEEDEEQNAAQD